MKKLLIGALALLVLISIIRRYGIEHRICGPTYLSTTIWTGGEVYLRGPKIHSSIIVMVFFILITSLLHDF